MGRRVPWKVMAYKTKESGGLIPGIVTLASMVPRADDVSFLLGQVELGVPDADGIHERNISLWIALLPSPAAA